ENNGSRGGYNNDSRAYPIGEPSMPVWLFGLVFFGAFALGSGLLLWTLARLTAMRFGSLAFACLAALGLIVSAIVHFSTFVGADPIEILPQIWFLQVVMLLVFIGA